MSIEECLDLYFKEVKVIFNGNAMEITYLSYNEMNENRIKAKEDLNKKTKEELIDYLLKNKKEAE